ncbi:GIY-YIG nuclease family protein [Xanthomarina sp. F2636L]|uniref:GIY-YIG nuclease family protein n=1 Tax=Xanthomarina sp. F2636L TaxID=2996018 RepID=UPI00225DCE3A|nr:GIY-YIG nuclease family protein [Xanthomarina sp. F2636L]MCX7549343.1 GIY-YIG nuclease family protein [Xanthomarina sp. F2636L]
MKFYYVYILECSDASFYIGVSSNIEKRLYQHNSGLDKNSYTYSRRPVTLKWLEMFTSPEEAITIEKQLKGWSRRKKIALINEDWDKLIEYSKNYTQFGKYGDLEGSSEGSKCFQKKH